MHRQCNRNGNLFVTSHEWSWVACALCDDCCVVFCKRPGVRTEVRYERVGVLGTMRPFRQNLRLPCFRSFSLVTYVLVCLFGLGSWVAINGVWAESAILVYTQPECADVTSILAVVVQLGNVGPLVYFLSKVLWQKLHFKQLCLEIVTVVLLLSLGAVACALLSYFWASTTTVLGSEHSVALFVFLFVFSLVDCTSSVVFVPFMKHLPAVYLSALYIGEGLSGVMPSLLGLGQGAVNSSVACTPGVGLEDLDYLGVNYGPSTFFLVLMAIMVVSGGAFISILVLPMTRKEVCATSPPNMTINSRGASQSSISQSPSPTSTSHGNGVDESDTSDTAPLVEDKKDDNEKREEIKPHLGSDQVFPVRMRQLRFDPRSSANPPVSIVRQLMAIVWTHRTILACIFLISFITNGSLTSISVFALSKYSNLSFLLAVELGLLANPIAALVFALYPKRFRLLTVVLTALIAILAVYVLALALSPSAFLEGLLGEIIIVSLNKVL